MRRIRFRGDDLARYDSLEALHVRLFIPPAGLAEPVWPMIGANGLLQSPPPEQRPAIRKYTIREIDAAAGALAIDFVLHDDAGPGSAFAASVQIGDRIGMAGPGGRGLKQAERYLFLADETGLPALARMLEHLPAGATGLALVEIADASERHPLVVPEGVSLRWLHRDGAAPGSTSLLTDALAMLDWPTGEGSLYLWAACEHNAFREIRAAARQYLRPGIDAHLVVSYWRAGVSEEQHAAEKRKAA
jgi:NADPH-dependent ferric siderophore reductase